MDTDLALGILRLFRQVDSEAWDLHAFFELAGDSRDRRSVLELVDSLVAGGYLETRGSDFYTITPQGSRAAAGGSLDT